MTRTSPADLRVLAALLPALALAGCVSGSSAERSPGPAAPPPRQIEAGLGSVIGADARRLEAMFGAPAQDFRGPAVRRLQFVGPACVLDAYLYAPAAGREPVVTWVDARLPNGNDIDRASCVAALTRAK